jgi:hypothetical protein
MTLFRWSSLINVAATHLGEPILAATPVSPVPRRAPGFGAWGHDPLTGAQVRYLVVTPTRVVAFSLDRDVRGPQLYPRTRVEAEAERNEIRAVDLRPRWHTRLLAIDYADGDRWELEVSLIQRELWAPVVAELGLVPPQGAPTAIPSA